MLPESKKLFYLANSAMKSLSIYIPPFQRPILTLLCCRIRATFTVSDLQNVAEDEFDGLSESDYENVNQAQPGEPIATRPEDSIAPSDRDYDGEIPGFPVRVNITIEKPGNGALLFQTTASDGAFEIHEVSQFDKADLAEADTAEKDWHRQSLYSGPAYGNLDEDLQVLFERYLEERGFNAELANIIPDYITVKEQKEYTRWLESKSPLFSDNSSCSY